MVTRTNKEKILGLKNSCKNSENLEYVWFITKLKSVLMSKSEFKKKISMKVMMKEEDFKKWF